ncbi:hypothetical protein ENSA7_80160 [Enhygromyxa salina]|uniref:Uncharacterized protein n=1 Tax=Enhygromyxa salina TaxID=215803 RepID=A0A2S9XL31_9BACT|nr:hypothetical protein ENSA7_80160 [Enhygromyxa salina]
MSSGLFGEPLVRCRSARERQRYLRRLSALGFGAWHDLRPRSGVSCEHAVVPQCVEPWWRDQGTQPREEVQRSEQDGVHTPEKLALD